MLDLIWDLFQQGQINDLNKDHGLRIEKDKSQDIKTDSLSDRLKHLKSDTNN